MIEIKRLNVAETYNIRKEILRKNIDLTYTFTGDLDKDTFHLGLFLNNQLIGIVSFMKFMYSDIKGSQYQLRGMATLHEFQGRGYGNKLIQFGLDILKEKQIDYIWCNARITAIHFYQKSGFQIIGKQFEIPKIGGHFVMYLKLTKE